ncbi:MAG: adenosine deaminase, partial [Bacteroidetes bacterium]
GISKAEYLADFVAADQCHDLAGYLRKANNAIALMQKPAQLIAVTEDLFRQLADDGVIYAEIRFAPLQHLQEGLTPQQVVEIVEKAICKASAQSGIPARLILCTLRHYTAAQSLETAQLVVDFKGSRVVALDIAADEAAYPLHAHQAAFDLVRQAGIAATAHAGEAKGAESVWESLRKLQVQRIGHGVRSTEDPKLVEYLRTAAIHLEVCPTSNIQTRVFPTIREHVVNELYEAGISLSINTDGRALSNTTLSREYQLLAETFAWNKTHFRRCNLAAITHAFVEERLKQQLRTRIEEAYV